MCVCVCVVRKRARAGSIKAAMILNAGCMLMGLMSCGRVIKGFAGFPPGLLIQTVVDDDWYFPGERDGDVLM